jgi:hypothetical protein
MSVLTVKHEKVIKTITCKNKVITLIKHIYFMCNDEFKIFEVKLPSKLGFFRKFVIEKELFHSFDEALKFINEYLCSIDSDICKETEWDIFGEQTA